jgi:hypothetical protein
VFGSLEHSGLLYWIFIVTITNYYVFILLNFAY